MRDAQSVSAAGALISHALLGRLGARTQKTPPRKSNGMLKNECVPPSMEIADLILPVFAVIVTGSIVGYTGYLSRAFSDALIHFAYNIAMPALLIVTIA